MILINEKNWEPINTIQDVSGIIRNYYNPELADALDELIQTDTHATDMQYILEYCHNLKVEIENLDMALKDLSIKLA